MEFLPAIEVDKIDSFTGFVTPKGVTKTGNTVSNLIKLSPQS